MARFREISKQKFDVLDRILTDQELIKAVIYDYDDFIYRPDIDYREAKEYVFDRFYPQRFIPGTPEEHKTYLTLSFEDYRPINGYFKSGRIRFSAFTHQSLYSSVDGFLRIDLIMERLDELFNSQRGIGIGKMEFKERNPITVTSEYHGEYVIYAVTDFN